MPEVNVLLATSGLDPDLLLIFFLRHPDHVLFGIRKRDDLLDG